MKNRNYNVFFNTHTVSGIVISVALYIIFFAGAFALFKTEIKEWETGVYTVNKSEKNLDYNWLLSELDKKHTLHGRNVQFRFKNEQDHIYSYLEPSKDSLATKESKESLYLETNIHTAQTKTYSEQYNLGEFLYRLHFFGQIPLVGIYLAGLVSVFFLFAIVTGVIVHWRKTIPNLLSFNPKIALKRVWTDAHTALGILGLPFQLMYAITGAFMGLVALILLPANLLYDGDQERLMNDLRPSTKTYQWTGSSAKSIPSFNAFRDFAYQHWGNDIKVIRSSIKNYGGTNMKFCMTAELYTKERFIGKGHLVYNPFSQIIEFEKKPHEFNFIEDTQRLQGRLHFGDFGGLPVKLIYFILSLITCFVIISGVLIWVEARNKKSKTLKQRLYTSKVGHIYLAISLSLLPVTALSFLYVKCTSQYVDHPATSIYYFYFSAWLIMTILFSRKKDNYYTNKTSLLLGAIFGFMIPVINGLLSQNWIWNTIEKKQYSILLIDTLWIAIASIALIIYFKIKPKSELKTSYNTIPLDYKAIALQKKKVKQLQFLIKFDTNHYHLNTLTMKSRIISLWMLIIIGFIFHHIYGLAAIFFNKTVLMDGADGTTPLWVHQFRILMEGLAFLFAVLTTQMSQKWFKWTSLIWSIVLALFNIYHLIEAILHEPNNYSEIFILLLMVITSIFLVLNLNQWRRKNIQ